MLITKSKQIKSLNQTEKQQQQPLKQEDNSDSAIIKKNRNQLKMIYLILVNMIMILSLNNKNHNKMKRKFKDYIKRNETVRPDDILIKLNYDYLLSMNNLQLMINEITKVVFNIYNNSKSKYNYKYK